MNFHKKDFSFRRRLAGVGLVMRANWFFLALCVSAMEAGVFYE